MNGKRLKKSLNSIELSERAKERIINILEQSEYGEAVQRDAEEYVFEDEPAKTPILHYAMTAISACAVLAVAAGGAYLGGRGIVSPDESSAGQKASVGEVVSLTRQELSGALAEYNQEHGTELRFPTEEECAEAGTNENECFEFLSLFPDKEAFLQYVDVLAEKGEAIIGSFHRTSLYGPGVNDTEVTGYHYYFYNASGQTYGSSGVEGLRYSDVPDLIAVMTAEGATGYITKEDLCGDEPSSPEEAVEMMEERKKAYENGTYSPTVVNAYDTDGKTIVGSFVIGGGEIYE